MQPDSEILTKRHPTIYTYLMLPSSNSKISSPIEPAINALKKWKNLNANFVVTIKFLIGYF